MNQWKEIEKEKPYPLKEIEAMDFNGNNHYVYLCNRGCCWRCSIMGSGILNDVIKWRYVNQ